MHHRPDLPAGPKPTHPATDDNRADLITTLAKGPAALRAAADALTPAQLDTRYRNWTARQIVHHVADSHCTSYLRFKLALTADTPTITPYNETTTAQLPDHAGDIAPSLNLLDALHQRWDVLLQAIKPADFQRAFHHPELGETVTLNDALPYYAWHIQHHAAQLRVLANA